MTNTGLISHSEKAYSQDEYKVIGRRLRQEREAKGLTLEQAAIAAGVTAHNIHCYEQGSPAPPDVLMKLTHEVYRCSLHEILRSSPE
jgi:transcriptional regulator with XRE-family HTH domain